MSNISVVIPLYNKARHVERAIQSVLAQTVQDFEIIVVDDGSTDNGADIVMGIQDTRLRLIRQDNRGVSSARNRGIQESTTGLIAFLDADDAYKPEFFKKILNLKLAFPNAGAYATNYELHRSDGPTREEVRIKNVNPLLLDVWTYFDIGKTVLPVWTSALVVKKNIFSEVGFFPEGVALGQDLDMWIRILFSCAVAFDPSVGSTYFTNADNRSCLNNSQPREMFCFKTIDELCAKKSYAIREIDAAREFKNRFILQYAKQKIRKGSTAEGRHVLLEMKTRSFMIRKWYWIFLSFAPASLLQHLRRAIKVFFWGMNVFYQPFHQSPLLRKETLKESWKSFD